MKIEAKDEDFQRTGVCVETARAVLASVFILGLEGVHLFDDSSGVQ
jgi:hypothetical protein